MTQQPQRPSPADVMKAKRLLAERGHDGWQPADTLGKEEKAKGDDGPERKGP